MTDRGLPIVDGAPACPFVAFEDDRDGRALAPDHRHRCYAEPRPAPRALAHQEAYCLSSAFPVCPTFQDWARREAAAARPSAPEGRAARDDTPVSRPLPPRDRESRHAPGTDTPPPLPPKRHQARDWAAPPPWSGAEDDGLPRDPDAADAAPPAFLAGRPGREDPEAWAAASRGLAGSAADRLAGAELDSEPASAYLDRPAAAPAPADDQNDDEQPAWAPPPARPPTDPGRRRAPVDRHADRGAPPPSRRDPGRRREEDAAELFGPAWEKPRRYEAYPTLRTRMSLPSFSGLWVGVAALALAAVVLFFVGPMILGLGGNSPDSGAGATPSASSGPSAEPSPTLEPAPTAVVYVVARNDTMSKIAKKFGVTIEQLMAANPKIKNPDKISIGDEITIPAPVQDDELGASEAP